MKPVLLIRSLEVGGAERQMVALARGLAALGHEVRVLTFYPGGALRGDLDARGVSVTSLGKCGRWDMAGFLLRLVAVLRQERPTVLYSFLPTANLVGLVAARLAGIPQVVWGVRASNMDYSQYDRLSQFEAWLGGKLARYANKIICNSQAGAMHHAGLGYPADKITVIVNGIDTARYCFDSAGRDRVRAEWGILPSDLLIGLPARFDPMKGHETSLRALAQLSLEMPAVKLACVGSGPLFDSLRALSRELQIDGQVVWAGTRKDMPAVYSAFDLSTSSSYGEGFSNTIAEAMACGRMCVATDVGDSATIVCNDDWVVPARSSEALAQVWRRALALTVTERAALGAIARQRIVENYSVDCMVKRTLEVIKG
jgi:glycosyltransferase involved in cell wall biosynthesis